MENLNNQAFNEENELVEVTYYEPLENEVMVTTDSIEESEGNKVNGLVIVGAVAAGAVSAFVAGKALYGRIKRKKIEKDLEKFRQQVIDGFTKSGEIDEYTDEEIEEIARYNYFIAKEGLKPVCGQYHNSKQTEEK